MIDPLFVSLVICTYRRADSLKRLLASVEKQILRPSEVLVIDGSPDQETSDMIKAHYPSLVEYFLVEPKDRGLTKQRNFGIAKISSESDVVAFLDDDTVLTPFYFQVMADTFSNHPEITGVGGVAINEDYWKPLPEGLIPNPNLYYTFEGYYTPEPLRNRIRNFLGLNSPLPSFSMPDFSHVRASGFPITGRFYEVDMLVGMSMAFRRCVVEGQKYSTYFEGYGLYEDADYSIRALRFGKNVMHTSLQLYHYHDPSGRPNTFKYGKMVIKNGFYVWRLKYPNPSLKARLKWNLTAGLLTLIRGSNFFIGPDRLPAGREFLGRIAGWFSLWMKDKPLPKSDLK